MVSAVQGLDRHVLGLVVFRALFIFWALSCFARVLSVEQLEPSEHVFTTKICVLRKGLLRQCSQTAGLSQWCRLEWSLLQSWLFFSQLVAVAGTALGPLVLHQGGAAGVISSARLQGAWPQPGDREPARKADGTAVLRFVFTVKLRSLWSWRRAECSLLVLPIFRYSCTPHKAEGNTAWAVQTWTEVIFVVALTCVIKTCGLKQQTGVLHLLTSCSSCSWCFCGASQRVPSLESMVAARFLVGYYCWSSALWRGARQDLNLALPGVPLFCGFSSPVQEEREKFLYYWKPAGLSKCFHGVALAFWWLLFSSSSTPSCRRFSCRAGLPVQNPTLAVTWEHLSWGAARGPTRLAVLSAPCLVPWLHTPIQPALLPHLQQLNALFVLFLKPHAECECRYVRSLFWGD